MSTSAPGPSTTEGDLPLPRIVYSDETLVVVDKPSGMPSVPARTPHDPLAVAIRLQPSLGTLEAVHRLDRDTSGLLVLARDKQTRRSLGIALEARRVAKRYLAVVVGTPRDVAGTVDLPLAPDRECPPRHRIDHTGGRPATTAWKLLGARAPDSTNEPTLSLMDLDPLTGRSHQLRIHLASLGCPILGDRLYGSPPHDARCRLALHATALAFDHPTTGKRMVFTASPPASWPWVVFASEITMASGAWSSA